MLPVMAALPDCCRTEWQVLGAGGWILFGCCGLPAGSGGLTPRAVVTPTCAVPRRGPG